ncbi:DMT family transporter [Limosilactobacillus caccae]|jgi:quaternary ammonium compound-resistance protein SugE|uniref:DMT family transporter n=1 Tax=Limosilactobacillus caccae TaxID=1926284 RepID=UPI0009702C7A|nr:multidrug efflux SMR transporter [Limosilactobacillus caccae]
MSKSWLHVILGGILEIFWVLSLKMSHNFTVFPYNIITLLLVVVSFYLFSKGMEELPSGVAYTVYTGIGAVGTIIFGIIFLGESVSTPKIVFALLLIVGILGLKMTSEG